MEVIAEEDKENSSYLTDCTCFSQGGRIKGTLTCHSINKESTYCDKGIATDNSCCKPERNRIKRQSRKRKGYIRSSHEKFICCWVEDGPNFCFLFPEPGKEAI